MKGRKEFEYYIKKRNVKDPTTSLICPLHCDSKNGKSQIKKDSNTLLLRDIRGSTKGMENSPSKHVHINKFNYKTNPLTVSDLQG